ncbi:MAG: hypothetical protein IH886_12260 [Nitrospinae bacterium]|nr:hypothetical protein [Nitrospinota bacterium]
MHYTGMAAGTFEGAMHYKPGLFALSVLIAVAAATAALWLAMKLIVEKAFFKDNRVKIVSALIMGIAIAGMHFTGMAATVHVTQSTPLPNIQSTLDTRLLALVDDTAAVAPVDEVQALFGWQNLGAIGPDSVADHGTDPPADPSAGPFQEGSPDISVYLGR